VADHGGVDKNEQGLGDQGSESGYRQGEDLPIETETLPIKTGAGGPAGWLTGSPSGARAGGAGHVL